VFVGDVLHKNKVGFMPDTLIAESRCSEDNRTRFSERASSVMVCGIDCCWSSEFQFQ